MQDGVTQDMFEVAVECRGDGYYMTVTGKITGIYREVGPFDDEAEARNAAADLSDMCTSVGGIDVPLGKGN